MQKPQLPVRACKLPRFMECSTIFPPKQFLYQKVANGIEHKNVFHLLVQKPHLPVQACKLPRFMEGIIGPRMENCVNLGPPIPMVQIYDIMAKIKVNLALLKYLRAKIKFTLALLKDLKT